MRFVGVFNKDGGTFRDLDLRAFARQAHRVFAAHGHELHTQIVAGRDLLDALDAAATDANADVVLAGGGDGTISAAAAACFQAGKPLAVLPAGTMNLFARTLRIPLDLEEALEAIAAGRRYDVDIATANGRAFVHQYSVGVHARLVRIREQIRYRNRFEKMWASLKAVAGALAKPLHFEIEMATAQAKPERRMASGVFVTNNLFAEGHVPFADRIDGGVLGLYVVKPMSQWALARLFMRMLIGRWKVKWGIAEQSVDEVTLRFPRRRHSDQAVIDGELIPLEDTVRLRVHPGALKVYAPTMLAGATTGEAAAPQ